MGTDDTAKVEKKKERRMAMIEKAALMLVAALGSAGAFGAAKATTPEPAPVQAVRDVGAEKAREAEDADRKIIIEKLGKVENALTVLGKSIELDKSAVERRFANLEAENRELRANDKEQDKIIAKLVAEGKK